MASEPINKVNNASALLGDIERQSANGDFGGFTKSITKCLAPPKAIHEVAAEARFWQCLKSLLNGIPADNDQAVAAGLAEIGRLSAALKSKGDCLSPLAFHLLERCMPSHFCYGDADATTFAAKGWACSGRAVDLSVATRTVVAADAPKPLIPWLELALSAGEPSSVIEHIAAALAEHSASERESPKNRSSRLQRLLKAMRSVLDDDRVELDGRIPKALAELVAKAFYGVERPVQFVPAARAVEELMSLTRQIIRMDLRLLTEPAIYDSMRRATGWLPEGGWRRYTKSGVGAANLRKILLDGLVILLKQRNPNKALLDSHQMLSSSRQAALTELKAVAKADREIPPDEREWLASGGESSVAHREQEVTESDDLAIAMALLAVEALARCDLVASGNHGDSMAGELASRALDVRERTLSVARRRNLRTFGEPGEVVKFSPNAHRMADSDAAPDNVRIVEPGVESDGQYGARIIVPALVTD